MLKSLYTIPISRRVFMAFVLTTAFAMIAMSLLSIYYFNALVARDQAVKTAFAAQHTANDQLVNLQRMNALLRTRFAQVFATTDGTLHDPSLEASGGLISIDILTREVDFAQSLTYYQNTYALNSRPMSDVRTIVLNDDPNSGIGANQQAALTIVGKSEWPRYWSLQDQILGLLNPSTNPTLLTNPGVAYEQAYSLLFQDNGVFLNLTNDWQTVVDSSSLIGQIVTNVGPSQIEPIIISTSTALLFTLFVILVVGYLVNITITRPLRLLVVLTQRIAAGENNIRATVQGRDEIAQVATSMNNMLDYIVKLITESESQRARLQLQVEQLSHQVDGVGQGDLRAHATVRLADLGKLATSFNFMVDAFSALIRQVKKVAHQVVSSTIQIAQLINQLTASANQQIGQMKEASEAVERVTSASQYIAQTAANLSQVATEARETAKIGATSAKMTVAGIHRVNTTMQETMQKVQSMYEHSSAIDEIANTMRRIAQKTQRLALDAAIQVQVSHDTNSGFAAIVADIRRLAGQAQEDAQNIARITGTVITEIRELQRTTLLTVNEITGMTTFASEAELALEATVTAVERQASGIQDMAQVASKQVPLSQTVGAAMQQIAQTTSQGRNVIQVIFQEVNNQRQYVTQLSTSVEVFRVSEQQQVSSSREDAVQSGTK